MSTDRDATASHPGLVLIRRLGRLPLDIEGYTKFREIVFVYCKDKYLCPQVWDTMNCVRQHYKNYISVGIFWHAFARWAYPYVRSNLSYTAEQTGTQERLPSVYQAAGVFTI